MPLPMPVLSVRPHVAGLSEASLLYPTDDADENKRGDLGGRRIG